MLKIQQFTFGPVQENTYILYDEQSREAAIIDPGCMRHSEEEKLSDFITEHNLTPKLLLCTHQHFDHVWGAAFVLRKWPDITAYANAIDFELLPLPSEQLKSYAIPLPLEDVPAERYTMVGQDASAAKIYAYSLSLGMLQVTLPSMLQRQGYYSLATPCS